jgi:hypothetical protein
MRKPIELPGCEASGPIPVFDSDDLTLVRVAQSFDLLRGEDEFTVWIQGRLHDGTSITDAYRFWKTADEKWDYKEYGNELMSHLRVSSLIPPESLLRYQRQLFELLLRFLRLQPSALARPFDSPKSPT